MADTTSASDCSIDGDRQVQHWSEVVEDDKSGGASAFVGGTRKSKGRKSKATKGSKAKLQGMQDNEAIRCPDCAGPLVWRDYAKGVYAGGWVCNHFDTCGGDKQTRAFFNGSAGRVAMTFVARADHTSW